MNVVINDFTLINSLWFTIGSLMQQGPVAFCLFLYINTLFCANKRLVNDLRLSSGNIDKSMKFFKISRKYFFVCNLF